MIRHLRLILPVLLALLLHPVRPTLLPNRHARSTEGGVIDCLIARAGFGPCGAPVDGLSDGRIITYTPTGRDIERGARCEVLVSTG